MENVPLDDGTEWSPISMAEFAWSIATGIGAGALTKYLEYPAQTCPGYTGLLAPKCNVFGQPVAEVGEFTFLVVAVLVSLGTGLLVYLYRLWDHNRS